MVVDILFFAVGLVLLVKGADILIDGSSAIAKRVGVSQFIIGLTVVAFGTSLPELAVVIVSNFGGVSDISIGTIIGSNISNVGLVLGVGALLGGISIKKAAVRKEIMFVIGISLIFILLAFDSLFNGASTLSLVDGIILLVLFGMYNVLIIQSAKKERTVIETALSHVEKGTRVVKETVSGKKHMAKNIALVIGGMIGVIIGAEVLVDSSINLARLLGISEALIALTMIAIGTSLPELFTSIVAALKKNNDIAMGNIIGSNIFNILLVLGISSVISPIVISDAFFYDAVVMVLFSVLLLPLIINDNKIKRHEGVFLVMLYIFFITAIYFF